jgi:RNA polymerase sigma-70 factor (ECF subfamily)
MLLVFQQGMKYQEVAKQLNISLSTVKNLVAKSVEKLRERLNDEALIYFFSDSPQTHLIFLVY